MELGIAENAIVRIQSDVENDLDKIVSEEDAKIHIINRLLNEALGWNISDFRMEKHHDNGFSDYVLCIRDKPVLIIEAKKIGEIDIPIAEKSKVAYLKIRGSSLKSAIVGIKQAASYAVPNGLSIAVLTDGLHWVIFKTFVQGENYMDKEAVVFPSFTSILNDFVRFYDLLAKAQFEKRIYNKVFDSIHHNRLNLTQKLIAPIEENEIRISSKSEIAYDLERVFTNFFSRLSGEVDEDMLFECFVETRESRIADFALEKITTSVLSNILPGKHVDDELEVLIKYNIDSSISGVESGQTVFIVGPTGAGKTTFLDRFFRKTLPASLRRRCVVGKLNCLDATGSDETVLSWMTEKLIGFIEQQIYSNSTPTWDELVGLYHSEYVRRLNGVDAHLYKRSKDDFKVKFGEYLERIVETNREDYLKRILLDVVMNRKMLPVFIIDNTDEFPMEYKQKVFQFSQALKRHCNHCVVIFPVTDKSAWAFSKTDIFGIYRSRSFFLPTPSPREIFRKRIGFLKGKLSEQELSKKELGDYFSNKGIKISIDDLNGFAQVLERIFVDNDYTSKTLGELTNYNIRRILLLSQRIITSSVIKIEDLISSYLIDRPIVTSFSKFMDALMKGNYELYKLGDSHEIFPTFSVGNEIRQSPLLNLRILALLAEIRNTSRTIEEKHLEVQSIVAYFDSLGCSETSVEFALNVLHESCLIEPYDPSYKSLSSGQRFAISYKGLVHLRLSVQNKIFTFQMGLTTAITSEEAALRIRSCYRSSLPLGDKIRKVSMEFIEYLLDEDKKYISQGISAPEYEGQKTLLLDLKKFLISGPAQEDLVATLGDEYSEGLVKEAVIATVDYYDNAKGYGFAEVDNFNNEVFIHIDVLREKNISSLNDGDILLCDISRGPKGFFISKVHEVELSSTLEVVACRIVRIFSDRGYGFVNVNNSNKSAFFHVSVFPLETRKLLEVGQEFEVEIGPDRTGEGYQIRRVVSSSRTA